MICDVLVAQLRISVVAASRQRFPCRRSKDTKSSVSIYSKGNGVSELGPWPLRASGVLLPLCCRGNIKEDSA